MGVSEAESEKVLRGSREGFSDSVKTNSALVRKRIRDTRMKVEEYQSGVRSNTTIQILYIEDLVHEELFGRGQKQAGRIQNRWNSGQWNAGTAD